MNSVKEKYPKLFEIFYPGFEARNASHPLLNNLQNPFFNKFITLLDQVVILINHSTLTYEYASQNVAQIFGYPAKKFIGTSIELMGEIILPEDMEQMQSVVFPAYDICMAKLTHQERLRLRLTYTFRIRHPKGHTAKIYQQSFPLTEANGKTILGLVILTDITAFKQDDKVYFRNELLTETGEPTVLSQNCNVKSNLSDVELKVIQLTASGRSEKEIADQLNLSIHTIKSHRKKLLSKTGTKNSAELVRYAMGNMMI